MRWNLAPRLWPRQALIGLVQAYRYLLKPWLGNACRFEPTCSAYALDALRRHGARRGAALAGWRLARCHPWCAGGLDPVPDRPLFTGLLSRSRATPRSASLDRAARLSSRRDLPDLP